MLNIALSISLVIFPVIIIIMIGYIAKQKLWISKKGAESISKFVFYVSLPCLLIDEISKTNVKHFLDLKGPIVFIIVSIITASLGYLFAYIKKLPPSTKGVWAQSSFRGNISFIGLAISTYAIGTDGLYYCSVIIATSMPIYNTLSIFFLTLAHENISYDKKYTLYINIIKDIIKHPLSIGIISGILLSFVRPPTFSILDISLNTLKKTTLPLALISMGAQLNFKASIKIIPKAIIPISYKLILSPLIGGILLSILDAEHKDFISTMVLLASPTAVLSYVMAKEMKGDSTLSLNIIIASTLLCFITYCIMLFILGILNIWKYQNIL